VSSSGGAPAAIARGPIWLIRHAQTDWTGRRWCGRSDPELSEPGREAARRLGAEIAAEVEAEVEVGQTAGAVVLSSPLRRAYDTARAIALALDASIQVEPDLTEVDFGAADGLTWDELIVAHPTLADRILAGGDPDWPEGETADAVAVRARTTANRILDLARTTPLVVVTHGGLLVPLASYLGAAVPAGPFAAASALRLDAVTVT